MQYITLRNFRAFREQRFNLSRINVFVGPNNSGKSSVISAINLVAQTLLENEENAPLVLRGQYEDLGTFLDVVHGNNARTALGIEIGVGKFSHKYEYKYRTQLREIQVGSYEVLEEGRSIYKFVQKKNDIEIKYYGKRHESWMPSIAKRKPFFRGFRVFDRNIRNVTFESKTKFKNLSPEQQKKIQYLERSMNIARSRLSSNFYSFDTVSPFRDPPTRTFLFSGVAPANVGRTGANAIDILVNDNFRRGKSKANLVNSVSDWFKSTKMGKGIRVKPLTSRHYEICLVGHDGSDHNICDVGFGCSQVLPVLVGALNLMGNIADDGGAYVAGERPVNPTFVVQEPEIHLHPNAQADLGSFFANLFKSRGQLFIETHSPDLIVRLQRHVAEGLLRAEDVKVFYIHGGRLPPKVTELSLKKDGMFKQKWPGGFFPQRQRESFELAKVSSKHFLNDTDE